jgi:hypothetical protein
VDVSPNPIAVTPLGPERIMLETHHLPALIQQFKLGIGDDSGPNPLARPVAALLTLTAPCLAHRLYFQ